MSQEVFLLGSELGPLVPFSLAFRGRGYSVTLVENDDVLGRAMALAAQRPAWMVVLLKGSERLQTCIDLASAAPLTLFVLPFEDTSLGALLEKLPLAVAGMDEEPFVVLARLVAMAHASTTALAETDEPSTPANERGRVD